MTLKASFFNKGIYKSTVKRFLWGAILYFIVLFISTGMAILLSIDKTNPDQYRYLDYSILFSSDYSVFPTLLIICVPTITAVLIFRFIHSKKTAVFTHSLPTNRTANYISSLLAGFTLMAVPVILNGIILMIISLCGYQRFFDAASCLIWIVLSLYLLFILFSCSVFTAVITGNSFAMIGLNILIHSFVLLGASGFSAVADKFLFGYGGDNALLNRVMEYNFIADTATAFNGFVRGRFEISSAIFNVIAAVILYAVAYFLYKKRRLEAAEEVAAYKCLNPIYKYLATFLGVLAAFSIFSSFLPEKPLPLIIIVVIVAAVIYFACEMVLKKTLRVWGSYKGFIGFAAFCVVFTAFTVNTSFFGYETHIPKKENIEKATIYNYYHREEPFTADESIIEGVIATHSDIIKNNVYTIRPVNHGEFTRLHIKYQLENGNVLHRAYYVSTEECAKMMDIFYENEAYKKSVENVFEITDNIINVYVRGIRIDTENRASLIEALKKDVLELSYSQQYQHEYSDTGFEKGIGRININADYEMGRDEENNIMSNYMNKTINSNYVNTIAWLKENNIWEKLYTEDKYKDDTYTSFPETAEVSSVTVEIAD